MTPHPPGISRRLVSWLVRGDAGEVILGDLDEEFAESLARGATVAQARWRYRRQSVASIAACWRERVRPLDHDRHSVTFSNWWPGLKLDVRQAFRRLMRAPGFTAVAMLSLAIGIGANAALWRVTRTLLVEALPVDRPDELALVYWGRPKAAPNPVIQQIGSSSLTDASTGVSLRSNVAAPLFRALQAATKDHLSLAAFNLVRRVNLEAGREPPIVGSALLVSGNFFATLRPPVALGRLLAPEDDRPEAPPVAVISDACWNRLFGRNPAALGAVIHVNGAPLTIVGVTDRTFHGLSTSGAYPSADVTTTLTAQPAVTPQWSVDAPMGLADAPNIYWLRLLARVPAGRAGAAHDTAQATLQSYLLATGAIAAGDNAALDLRFTPAPRGFDSLRHDADQPLLILGGVVIAVLLIACANLAGLMLARGVARQREVAVRRALGASRLRLIREWLVESLLIAAGAGATSILMTMWSRPFMSSWLTAGLGRTDVGLGLDWRHNLFTLVVSFAAALGFGLIPAIKLTQAPASADLRHRTLGHTASRLSTGRLLLAFQIAISMPLVVGAALFLHSVHNLAAIPLGFNANGLVLFTVDPTGGGRTPNRLSLVLPRVLDRIEAVPGVVSATALENGLVSGWESDTTVTIAGQSRDMLQMAVAPRFFETVQMPIVAGRALVSRDTASAARVVVINQTAARRYFAGTPVVGEHFTYGRTSVEIVGVSADSKYDQLRAPVKPTMFQPYLQREGVSSLQVAVRTQGNSAVVAAGIARAVGEVDPHLPVANIRTQADQIDESIGLERVLTTLLTAFGGFALLLACLGLHGTAQYSVARRTNEIGIRVALGATRADVRWLVLRQVVALAAAGLAIGIPAALAVGPLVRTWLYDLSPTDPLTVAAAGVVMTAVALGAGFVPARRAARLDPSVALRRD